MALLAAAIVQAVVSIAPRLPARLLEAVVRLDDQANPIAETCRRVGDEAERLGLARPSYERIRVLCQALRQIPVRRQPSTTSVLLDIAFRVRPPEAFLDHISGVGVPNLRR